MDFKSEFELKNNFQELTHVFLIQHQLMGTRTWYGMSRSIQYEMALDKGQVKIQNKQPNKQKNSIKMKKGRNLSK